MEACLRCNVALHAACAGRKLGNDAFVRLIAATGDPDVSQKSGYTALASRSRQRHSNT